jgi:excisionase family DNA binding protein
VSDAAEVLSAEQVAELLGVDSKTVYDYANRGEIPCRRLGRRVLFGRRAILDWLNKPVNDER